VGGRIKDELARSIGFASDGTLDPVLDYRMQRCGAGDRREWESGDHLTHGRACSFTRYNDNLEKLSKAVGHYQESAQAYSHACVGLSHAFSEFFEAQLDDCAPDDEDHAPTK